MREGENPVQERRRWKRAKWRRRGVGDLSHSSVSVYTWFVKSGGGQVASLPAPGAASSECVCTRTPVSRRLRGPLRYCALSLLPSPFVAYFGFLFFFRIPVFLPVHASEQRGKGKSAPRRGWSELARTAREAKVRAVGGSCVACPSARWKKNGHAERPACDLHSSRQRRPGSGVMIKLRRRDKSLREMHA